MIMVPSVDRRLWVTMSRPRHHASPTTQNCTSALLSTISAMPARLPACEIRVTSPTRQDRSIATGR